MIWDGLDQDREDKVHPTEEEVFKKYGYNKNIIGIHTESELKYYRQAKRGQIYHI